MDLLIFSITIGTIYGVLWFFDSFFKTCMHYPYEAFLRGTGLTVKFFRLQWYTTAFNRSLIKWSNKFPKFCDTSFNLGVWVSIFLLPLVFLYQLLSAFTTKQMEPNNIDVGFEIMLPGVNLPLDEIGYYVAAIALSSVVHELGHGVAAVLEDVPVTGFGVYVFVILPIAYTEMAPDQLNSLKIWPKLRVLCAGIWHNISLSLIFYLAFLSLSTIFTPLYSVDIGVSITNIKSESKLLGEKGLQVNNVITRINDCKVRNLNSWYDCLLESIRQQPAYCISNDVVLNYDESIPVFHSNEGLAECCDRKNLRNLCFEYISESYYGVLELPQYMCLNVRKVIENSIAYCHKNIKCPESFCIKPIVNNVTTVIHLKRLTGKDVMYVGHPADLSKTIKVSEFVAKTKFFEASLVDGIATFMKYVVVFSFGLAVVNVIPCFFLDGQYITSSLTHYMLQSVVPKRKKRDFIAFLITCVGSVFIILIMVKAVWASALKITL